MTMVDSQANGSTAPKVDDEIVLTVEGVSKKFCRSLKRSLFYGIQDVATELVGMRQANASLRQGEFWALKDVSFQLQQGDALGLMQQLGLVFLPGPKLIPYILKDIAAKLFKKPA